MVYLGGPRGRNGTRSRGIYLHDPPPGYHRPRTKVPLRTRQRQAREERLLLRVTTVVLVPLVAALAVFFALMIAGFH